MHTRKALLALGVSFLLTACGVKDTPSPLTTGDFQALLALAKAVPASQVPLADQASQLKTKLETSFKVTAGHFGFYDEAFCQKMVELFGSCGGNNPTAPYATISFPKEPGLTEFPSPGPSGYTSLFHLAAREAVIVVLQTPPQARYYGYQTYLYSRDPAYVARPLLSDFLAGFSPVFGTIPGTSRQALFASLGDSINVARIAATAPTVSPFKRKAVYVTSTDKAIAAALVATIRATIPDAAIVEEKLPSEHLAGLMGRKLPMRYGNEAKADDFLVLSRFAVPENPAEADAYRKAPPAWVFKVTPSRAGVFLGHGAPVVTPKQGNSEMPLLAAQDALATSVASVERLSQRVSGRELSPLEGANCITVGFNCLGDTRDTTYTTVGPVALPASGGVHLVGVNHVNTKNAAYVSVAVYDEAATGLANFTDKDLAGSALRYPGGRNDLYAMEISRDCGARPYCLEVPKSFTGQNIVVTVRAYLKPGTPVGPSYEKIQAPTLLK